MHRPWHRVSVRPSILAGVCYCVAFYITEWVIVWRALSPIETAISWLFLLLTVAIAWKPIVFSVVLCAVSAIIFMLPVTVHMPTIFWGTWLALGILGAKLRPRLSIPIGALIAVSTAIPIVFRGQPITANTMTFACSFLLATFAGMLLRRHREYMRLKTIEQHQHEQIQLLSTLHDDVAGSLSYALLLCRNAQHSPAEPAAQSALPTICATLEETLQMLRTRVIAPLLASATVDAYDDEHDSSNGYAKLCQNMLRQQRRLDAAQFTGAITCTGEPESQLASAVSSMLTELCNNMLKHGTGSYTVQITFANPTAVSIVAVNDIRADEHDETSHSSQPTHHGMAMLKARVEALDGTIAMENEDNTWMTTIIIPD